ncbi:MAG: hypothetical protein QFB87_04650 [Patescibacteria group bacterium]|nr:hypothetical protein [Patescibacteria group bacterium]
MNKPLSTQEAIRMDAMAVVNQILDLANLDVVRRQSINDQCDDIIANALLDARLDENRKWSEGELSIYQSDDEPMAVKDVQAIIKSLADIHISHLKGEKHELDF